MLWKCTRESILNMKAIAVLLLLVICSLAVQTPQELTPDQEDSYDQAEVDEIMQKRREQIEKQIQAARRNGNRNYQTTRNQGGLQFGTDHDDPQFNLPPNSRRSEPQLVKAKQTLSPQQQDFQQQPVAPKPKPTELLSQVGTNIVGRSLAINGGMSFKRIVVRKLEKKYLFLHFNLRMKDRWQNASLNIIEEKTKKTVGRCSYTGFDSCYIPKEELTEDTVLVIVVKCQDDCSYSLKGNWDDLEHLKPGDQQVFMFSNDTSQLYHVMVDQSDFEEVRIHLIPRTTLRPFDNCKIYGKWQDDSDPKPKDYDFKSVSLYQDGEGVFLSKDKLKSKRFMILVLGQSQTTYELTMTVIKERTHEILAGNSVYEYIEAKKQKAYHIQFSQQPFDEYSLGFSTYSGSLQVGYYTDKELKNEFVIQPFQYMQDSEYIFMKDLIKEHLKDGIYAKVKAGERDATFTVKFTGRKKQGSVKLNQHAYSFIPVEETRFAHFNFKRWASQTEVKANLKFTAYSIHVLGLVDLEFRVCNKGLSQCTNPETFQDSTTPIKVVSQNTVAQKEAYELEISNDVIRKINQVEEQVNIVVKMQKAKNEKKAGEQEMKESYALTALEFVNNDKVLYLREGRPIEERLGKNQMKLYKYINSDPNVEEIRVHLTPISGAPVLQGAVKTEEHQSAGFFRSSANTLRFTENLTYPIIAVVSTETRAVYSISMQIVHKSDVTKSTNVLTISEDLSYNVQIPANGATIFEVVPIFYGFDFQFTASQSVIACAINMTTNRCLQVEKALKDESIAQKQKADGKSLVEKAPFVPQFVHSGHITKVQLEDRRARIKITNPFSNSIVEVKVIFHSRNMTHCNQVNIGKVYSQTVQHLTCLEYTLPEDMSRDLMLYVSKREFANLQYAVLLCGNSIKDVESIEVLHITPETVQKICGKRPESPKLNIVWSVRTAHQGSVVNKVHVNLLAQYEDSVTLLPEGVAYRVTKRSKQQLLETFAFDIVNKIDTKILVAQMRGRIKVYAKLVSQSRREIEKVSEVNFHFQSTHDTDYSQDPLIKITKEDILEAECNDCSILIAVYSHADDVGREIEFEIQAIQTFQQLTEDDAIPGYLQSDSIAYYQYYTSSKNTTLLFLLSDHNQQCASMFLGAVEYPSPKNHLVKALQSNELVYRHVGDPRKYFLTVKAKQTCDYTISVLTVDSSIHRLQMGKQNIVRLKKGAVQYFSFEHFNGEPFRVLSVLKYGDIQLHLNQSGLEVDRKAFTKEELSLDKFEYKSSSSNTLTVAQNDNIYCNQCHYFLAVEALANTEATIYLAYAETIITLVPNRHLHDDLPKKGDYSLVKYKGHEKLDVEITVHTGSIAVNSFYKQKRINNTFEPSHQLKHFEVDFIKEAQKHGKDVQKLKDEDPYYTQMVDEAQKPSKNQRVPINFIINALEDKTEYTLTLKSISGQGEVSGLANYRTVLSGKPNPVIISTSKPLCLSGHFRDSQDEILITTKSSNKVYLNNLNMKAKVGGEEVGIQPQFVNNILSLTLNPQLKYNEGYQICLKLAKPKEDQNQKHITSNEVVVRNPDEVQVQQKEITFEAVVSQLNKVNILKSNTDAMVRGQNIFVVHSDGQFLLDVFECSGEAKISYGPTIEALEKRKNKVLDMVSISGQRHAIKIEESSTTLVKVIAQNAVVRWLPIDYEAGLGLGYLKFVAGDLKYTSGFKEVSVSYQNLQQRKKSLPSDVEKVSYFLFYSNDTQKMERAMRCQVQQSNVDVLDLTGNSESNSNQHNYHSYPISKEGLQAKYKNSSNIYFNMVAKMALKVKLPENQEKRYFSIVGEEKENYKFVYHRQQIPLSDYKQSQLESIPWGYLIALVLSLGLVCILCTLLFTRVIVPVIARLTTSQLVEQGPIEEQMEVPPSSDRNQRMPETVAAETEEKMDM